MQIKHLIQMLTKVNKGIALYLLISCAVFAKDSNSSRNEITQKEIIYFLSKQVKESEKKLSQRMLYCRDISNDNVLALDWGKVYGSRNDKIRGMFYIYSQNIYKCEQEYKAEYTQSLIDLLYYKKYNSLDYKDEEQMMHVIFQGDNKAKIEIQYSKIPTMTKKYLEETIGDKMFNLQKAMHEIDEYYTKVK